MVRLIPLFIFTHLMSYIEQKKQELFNWISKTTYVKHHKDAGEGILEGTGKWLFETHDEFHAWEQPTSETRILWLNGDRMYSFVIFLAAPLKTLTDGALQLVWGRRI